jgi:hypothetical protein
MNPALSPLDWAGIITGILVVLMAIGLLWVIASMNHDELDAIEAERAEAAAAEFASDGPQHRKLPPALAELRREVAGRAGLVAKSEKLLDAPGGAS